MNDIMKMEVFVFMKEFILASKSPRRKELLQMLGISFEVVVSDADETLDVCEPSEFVCTLSRRKAIAVWKNRVPEMGNTSNKLVIGADTVVACDGVILGKPKDEGEAFSMLSMLQDNEHEVYTGVTFVWEADGVVRTHSFFACTKVVFYPMTEEERNAYIATGDCMDKAGAYGIQSMAAPYIREIKGDYNNVVGLPVAMLYQELKSLKLI
ncbi:MAG: Maf family protein [Lachnospiraceae bacterium]|nr:Maf family protein [Lachnospiraceae bacterium]